jgi:hypothetical protein
MDRSSVVIVSDREGCPLEQSESPALQVVENGLVGVRHRISTPCMGCPELREEVEKHYASFGKTDLTRYLTMKCVRCMFTRSGSDLGSLLAQATAFGDLAERPIQKRRGWKKG